ncbi:MAG: N-6 DNA methylase [Porphyromonadaceae bacterium]|nr:N-6 DNA methylase [Porphyromonadaceae bacterium]
MNLFQTKILEKQIAIESEKIQSAFQKFSVYFHNPEIQENIRNSKEEQFQEGFLRELFVKVLGYTLNPAHDFNLITEQKNETNSKKADGAILIDGEVVGIIELKDSKTTDLKTVEAQAFGYKNYNKKASYVIISNFEKLRFYIDNAVEFVEFNLFTLTRDEFSVLWLCLAYENIAVDLPKQLKSESVGKEEQITKELYKNYSRFKRELFADLTSNNPQYDRLLLFQKSQKLLDRLLFILFAEDRNLLPPNSIDEIIRQWEKLKDLDEYRPLYERYKKYFGYMNTGFKGKKHDIFAYNGGLFKPDEVLDSVIISDEVLRDNSLRLSQYNFESEVDVNILGHIFENSLTEIEEITQSIAHGEAPAQTSKRKKDGVFYTPRYITSYIVENTIERLCTEKKAELDLDETEYAADKKRQKTTKIKLADKLQAYRAWLLSITICDPACGSGAFLNAALEFLINEHRLLDELNAKLFGDAIVFPDIENTILENNLYGVDINEESVEIAKLALWLRTAKPHRKLNVLSNNIKCGNSLISDPEVAGNKAFDWEKEFPHVFAKGGFDVVIGNPPYGAEIPHIEKDALQKYYNTFEYQVNTYVIFYEQGLNITKQDGVLGFITPATFTYQFYFKKLRDFFQNYRIESVCKYFYEVFADADIGDAISLIVRKVENNHGNVKVLFCNNVSDIQKKHKEVPYLEFVNKDGTYNLYNSEFNLKKIHENTRFLTDIANVVVGIKAYQNGKGVPKQTSETVKDKIFTSDKKEDDTYIQCVVGKNFHRYKFLEEPQMYLSYGKWLAEPRENAPFFDDEKIILRQTADALIANIDFKQRINLNNVYNIGVNDFNFSLRYIIVLLNSKLFNFLYQNISQEKGRLFAEVKKVNLAKLPIKQIPLSDQQPFIEKADQMLFLNSELQTKRQRFLNRLTDNFENLKITGALEKFDESDFKAFLSALKKQKIALSLKQQDEWEEYFNDYKSDCNQLSAQIAETDQTIDRMVYELYGLTEEEIGMVEK